MMNKYDYFEYQYMCPLTPKTIVLFLFLKIREGYFDYYNVLHHNSMKFKWSTTVPYITMPPQSLLYSEGQKGAA